MKAWIATKGDKVLHFGEADGWTVEQVGGPFPDNPLTGIMAELDIVNRQRTLITNLIEALNTEQNRSHRYLTRAEAAEAALPKEPPR